MTAMVEALGIRKWFGALEVIKGVSLSVARGEVVCIIGPSGSGKSTFLRCLNWLEVPEEGEIRIEGRAAFREVVAGRPVAQAPREIGISAFFVPAGMSGKLLAPGRYFLEDIQAGDRRDAAHARWGAVLGWLATKR